MTPISQPQKDYITLLRKKCVEAGLKSAAEEKVNPPTYENADILIKKLKGLLEKPVQKTPVQRPKADVPAGTVWTKHKKPITIVEEDTGLMVSLSYRHGVPVINIHPGNQPKIDIRLDGKSI